MNTFFSDVIAKLEIKEVDTEMVPDNIKDKVERAVFKFKKHPSVIKIKDKIQSNDKFHLKECSLGEIVTTINELNKKKPTTFDNVPAKIIVEYQDICSKYIHHFYNDSISKSIFPYPLKMADITPVHKKDNKSMKENYRPVSILSSFSKIFKKIIYDDISKYMEESSSFGTGYGCES